MIQVSLNLFGEIEVCGVVRTLTEVMVQAVYEQHPKVDLDKAVRHQSIHVIVLHKQN